MKCSASVSASLSNPLVGSRRTQDLDLWVREINAFVHSELRDYRQRTPAFLEFLAKQDAAEEAQQHVTNVGSAGTVGTAGGGVSDGGGSSEALIRDVEKKGDNKKVQIWESVGGYHHPQPGSRLLQYGTIILI